MKLKVFLLVFLFFSFLGTVSAMSTTINVKTLPSHSIFITPVVSGTSFQALSSPVYGFSGAYGEDQIIIETEENSFSLFFVIKEGDTRVYSEQTTKVFQAGGIYDVIVLPEGIEPLVKPEIEERNTTNENVTVEVLDEVNESEESNFTDENVTVEVLEEVNESETEVLESPTIETQNLTEEKQKKITGFASGNSEIFNSKTLYYVGGGILLIMIIFFVFETIKHRNKTPKEIKITKLSELKEDKENKINGQEEIIKEAEDKIKEARKEIENIKGNNKIARAKKKLIEDEKELMRLREEEREEKKEKEEKKDKKEDKDKDKNEEKK